MQNNWILAGKPSETIAVAGPQFVDPDIDGQSRVHCSAAPIEACGGAKAVAAALFCGDVRHLEAIDLVPPAGWVHGGYCNMRISMGIIILLENEWGVSFF